MQDYLGETIKRDLHTGDIASVADQIHEL